MGVLPRDMLQPARWFAVRRLLGSSGTPRDRRQVLALTKAIADWREHLPASASEERFERWRGERGATRDNHASCTYCGANVWLAITDRGPRRSA